MRELKLLMLLIPALAILEFAPPFEYHLVMAQAGVGTTTDDTSLTTQNSSTSNNETPSLESGVSSFDELVDKQNSESATATEDEVQVQNITEQDTETILRNVQQKIQELLNATSSETETSATGTATVTPVLPDTEGTTTESEVSQDAPTEAPMPTADATTTVPVLTPVRPTAPSSSTTYPNIEEENARSQSNIATTTTAGTVDQSGGAGSSETLGDHILSTFTGNPYEFDRFSVSTTRTLLTIATILAILGLFLIRGGFGFKTARVTPLFIKEKSYGNQ